MSASRDVVAPDINAPDSHTGRGPDAEIPKDEQERAKAINTFVAAQVKIPQPSGEDEQMPRKSQ